MASGEVGILELVDYRLFRDPNDMIEKSWWNFIGYKDHKPIADCRFHEYLALYASLLRNRRN